MANLHKIYKKLNMLLESVSTESIIEPSNPDYDRQYAEDVLYHTAKPLTGEAVWFNKKWDSVYPQPEGFAPGAPAPSWTPEQVVFAMAGDPNLLWSSGPRSPGHGRMGGSPLFRTAKRVAREFGRPNDRELIADLYSNGFVPLVRKMKPGFDAGKTPIMGYMKDDIESAMRNGIGGSVVGQTFVSEQNTRSDILGLKAVLKVTDPAIIRANAEKIAPEFRDEPRFDKHPGNPFLQHSPIYYYLLTRYAEALEGGDEAEIQGAKDAISEVIDTANDRMTPIRGAGTGIGQAVSSLDRKTAVGVVSADATAPGEEGGGLKDTLTAEDDSDGAVNSEVVNRVLEIALFYDVGKIIGKKSKYQSLGAEIGAKGDVGGPFTANEFRYIIRSLGPIASNYPGRDVLRKAINIPREAKGWWQAGEDPEIDQMSSGALWSSKWRRDGYQALQPQAIADEMNAEIADLAQHGIQSARVLKTNSKGKDEAVGRVAINLTLKKAMFKMKVIATTNAADLGLDESTNTDTNGIIGKTYAERFLLSECANMMAGKIAKIIDDQANTIMESADDLGNIEFWKFTYNGKPREIIALGTYVNPKTGKHLLSGIDSSLVSQQSLEQLRDKAAEISGAKGSDDARYKFVATNLPTDVKSAYRTYDISLIQGLTKEPIVSSTTNLVEGYAARDERDVESDEAKQAEENTGIGQSVQRNEIDRKALLDAIEQSGHSVSSLARAVGVDPPAVSRLMRIPTDNDSESGRDPSISLAAAISKELGVSVESLFPDVFQ